MTGNRHKKILGKLLIGTLLVNLLTTTCFARTPENITAEGAVLIEPLTGTVLYEKGSHERLYPASITKVLTALLIAEDLTLSDTLTQSQLSMDSVPSDSSHIDLLVGDTLSVRDALYGLLLGSDNYIAYDFALKDSGSIATFASKMNERAKAIGAVDTHFSNPHGYHDVNHYTTAYDMALITKEAFNNPIVSEVAGTLKYTIHILNTNEEIPLLNSSRLLKSNTVYYNPNVVANKTGFHDDAQQTLVAKGKYDNIELIAVSMKTKTPGQYEDVNTLLAYGSQNFSVIKNSNGTYTLVNETYSNWAKPYIEKALNKGLISESAQDYQDDCSNEAFIELLVKRFPANQQSEVRIYLQSLVSYSQSSGKKMTRFDAANMIYALYAKEYIPAQVKFESVYVPGIETLSQYKQKVIRFVAAHGIMGGYQDEFSPERVMAYEEAICIALRVNE